MNTALTQHETSAMNTYRRHALQHLATPGDDNGEFLSHLVSRYLLHLRDGLGQAGAEAAAAGTPSTPDLLESLATLFTSIADRRSLTSDDPALQAVARVLLQPASAHARLEGGLQETPLQGRDR
ncbi:hypothetical protein [Kineococcus sp. SYSU DK003]|uniref:hypothetical protein n=1 Tax=Kineococcus sp. SYSU DK003 TaxID=3383124 RepID=UPI003D7D959C